MNRIQKTAIEAATTAIVIITEASIAVIVGVIMMSSAVFGFALWVKRMMTKAKMCFRMKK